PPIGQARYRALAALVDLLLCPVADVNRLAAPEHLDVLSCSDRGQVDLNRRAGRDRRGIRVHLGNQRHNRGSRAYSGDGSRCNKKEITACRMVRRRRCRHDSKPFLICSQRNPPGAPKTRPGRGCRRPPPPRRQKKPLFLPQSGGTSSPESFYWHPCRESASPLSARKRAMH